MSVERTTCPVCQGTGRDPMSDNSNFLPCVTCRGQGWWTRQREAPAADSLWPETFTISVARGVTPQEAMEALDELVMHELERIGPPPHKVTIRLAAESGDGPTIGWHVILPRTS